MHQGEFAEAPRCPLWGKCRAAAKGVPPVTLSRYHSTSHTPSVSLAGSEEPSSLPAPPPGSRGIVRIRPRFHKTAGACRTPQPLRRQLPFQGRFSRCPLWGKCRAAAKGVLPVTLSCLHSTNRTPSVRPFGLPAPPLGSQGGPYEFAWDFIRACVPAATPQPLRRQLSAA